MPPQGDPVALALGTPPTATERHLFPGGSFRNLAQQSQPRDTILVHDGSYGQFDVSVLRKTGYVTVKTAGDGHSQCGRGSRQ
jgi:hypothetical protein